MQTGKGCVEGQKKTRVRRREEQKEKALTQRERWGDHGYGTK
jgi:hypothetical protein